MSSLADLAKSLGKDVLSEMKESVGSDWESLSDAQKDSIKRTATFYVELRLRQKGGEDVEDKINAVLSIVQDWKVWSELALEDAFWKGVEKAAKALGVFLGAAAKSFLIP